MILYHFINRMSLPGIMKEGITLGKVPRNYKELVKGYQWLTVNPNFDQSWNGRVLVKYDRAEIRLTVEIPRMWEHKVLNWLKVCHKLSDVADDLNGFGDPENWRLFKGVIRPSWIKEIITKNGLSLSV